MAFVKGLDRGETMLLPACVEDFVDRENPVRAVDAFVDSLDLQALGFELRDESAIGRASYHPAVLLKLHLWGYFARIRSSRRLEDAASHNLNAIWLTGHLRPDHCTISRFRKSQSGAIARIFGRFTVICLELGLFGKELIAIDGTFIKAVNSRAKSYTSAQLKKLLEKIDRATQHYLEELEAIDAREDQVSAGGEAKGSQREDLSAKLESIREHRSELHSRLEDCEKSESGQITLTDPDSRQLHKRGKTTVGYNVQTAVDDKHHLIAACEVTQDGNDLGQLHPMAQKAKQNLGLAPDAMLKAHADTGYHSGAQLTACREANTEAFVPAPDRKTGSDGVYKEADFTHHPAADGAEVRSDYYVCPNGETLSRKKDDIRANGQGYRVYAASTAICRHCPLKSSCTKKRARELKVSIHKEVIEEVRERMDKAPDATWKRASLAEHPFGTFKDWTGGRDLLGKGMEHATAEVGTTFWSYNFKRALSIVGMKALLEAFKRHPATLGVATG
jgi:transposase